MQFRLWRAAAFVLSPIHLLMKTWQSHIHNIKIKNKYTASQKTIQLRLVWHNFTNSQCSVLFLAKGDFIQFSIHWVKKILNWLWTSCMVSIATVAAWQSVSKNWQDFSPDTSLTFSKIPDISRIDVKFSDISRFSRQVCLKWPPCRYWQTQQRITVTENSKIKIQSYSIVII